MAELVLVVIAVLVISATCSLFEAVLYSVPLAHVEGLATKHLSGRILQRLRRQVDRPIAAILALNTIANTAGAAVAGALVARIFGNQWLGLFSAGLTLTILLFSEIVPKTAGVLYSRPLAGPVALPLQLLVWAMAPLVWLCRGMTWIVTRGRKTDTHHISDEELIVLAKVGLGAGTIDPDEAAVIHNILTIERTQARRIMTPRSVMITLPAAMTADQARHSPHFYTHSRIPVYGKLPDDVVGWVHRPEVLRAVLENRGQTRLQEMMRPAWFVPSSVPVKRLLRLFLQRREQLAIVIDSLGTVLGLVTLEDVLEEILGEEIVDESDQVADMRELARQRRERLLGAEATDDDD